MPPRFAPGECPFEISAGLAISLFYIGDCTHNCRRDLYNKYMDKIDLPEPTYIPGVPYLEIGSDGTEIVKHIDYPITQPHAMFSDLHDKYPRQFETLLGDGHEKFWENVKEDDPKLHKHPRVGAEGF